MSSSPFNNSTTPNSCYTAGCSPAHARDAAHLLHRLTHFLPREYVLTTFHQRRPFPRQLSQLFHSSACKRRGSHISLRLKTDLTPSRCHVDPPKLPCSLVVLSTTPTQEVPWTYLVWSISAKARSLIPGFSAASRSLEEVSWQPGTRSSRLLQLQYMNHWMDLNGGR